MQKLSIIFSFVIKCKCLLFINVVTFLILINGCGWLTIHKTSSNLIWHDEFDGHKLDSSKWSLFSPGARRDAWNESNSVKLDGQGNLLIITRKDKHGYKTGMISTKDHFKIKYGYFECKVSLQKQVGHWSAFWLLPDNWTKENKKKGLPFIEIDIFEFKRNSPDTIIHAIHHFTRSKSESFDCHIPSLTMDHMIFGLDCKEDSIFFYVNNQLTWKMPSFQPMRKSFLILGLEVEQWAGAISENELPDTLKVDYIRVFKKKPEI